MLLEGGVQIALRRVPGVTRLGHEGKVRQPETGSQRAAGLALRAAPLAQPGGVDEGRGDRQNARREEREHAIGARHGRDLR